jgi:EmrB/QacA subfamily drug resistance transporter
MLGVLCLSILIIFVANSSLNVALPTLARDLGATESQLQWVVAAYSLVFAGLLFTAGAIGDRFGRKGTLQLGLATWGIAAALASQSTTMWQLIACRAVMGAGAAFIMPATLSILVNVFPARERAKAIAIWASTTGVAGALGPVASGWLLGHFWYGSIFLINLPIIAVALVGGWFFVPKSKDPEQGALDPVGAVLSIIGIGTLVYALIEAPDKGWLAPATLGAFAIAAVVIVLFVAWELRVDEPMLDIHFFRNPSFSTGSGGMILIFLSMFGVMFLLTQYFQLVLGYTALSAALRLLPMAPVMIIVGPLSPRFAARFGANRTVAFGMLSIATGMLLFHQIGLHTSYWYILVALIALVSGMALAMSPMTASIMSAVPARRAGAGSAMNDATRELGAALGIAVLGSIAASQYSSSLHEVGNLSATARDTARASIAGALHVAHGLGGAASDALALAARHAFVDGLHVAVICAAILATIAAFVTNRYLPRVIAPEGALHGPVAALEDTLELGLGGVPPVFADEAAQ